jgi:hypothetical protein
VSRIVATILREGFASFESAVSSPSVKHGSRIRLRACKDGTAHRLRRAAELDQETVSDGFDFAPAVVRKDRAQQLLVLVESASASASFRCVSAP